VGVCQDVPKEFSGGQVKIEFKDIAMKMTLSEYGTFLVMPKTDKKMTIVTSFV